MKICDLITGLRHTGIIVKNAESSTKPFKKLFDLEDDDIKIVSPDITKGESSFTCIPAEQLSWG